MAIKTAPVFSGQIYLGDISPEVKELEGDCDPKERAWVKVRQATEQDNTQISKVQQSDTFIWGNDGSIQQKTPITQGEVRAWEAYYTLTDAGNFFLEGESELFQFVNSGPYQKVAGGYEEFSRRWGTLPPEVTLAISRSIYSVNPSWDWLADRRHKCPNCGEVFVPTTKTRLGEAVSG